MKISLSSVPVNDQEKALQFYTNVLGFEKKADIPMGEFRWLTVVSPDDPDGCQLALEPDAHAAVKVFKQAIFADGIPFTAFEVDDMAAQFERLTALGVTFKGEPVDVGDVIMAIFEDTCGNLIQLYQTK